MYRGETKFKFVLLFYTPTSLNETDNANQKKM